MQTTETMQFPSSTRDDVFDVKIDSLMPIFLMHTIQIELIEYIGNELIYLLFFVFICQKKKFSKKKSSLFIDVEVISMAKSINC